MANINQFYEMALSSRKKYRDRYKLRDIKNIEKLVEILHSRKYDLNLNDHITIMERIQFLNPSLEFEKFYPYQDLIKIIRSQIK